MFDILKISASSSNYLEVYGLFSDIYGLSQVGFLK